MAVLTSGKIHTNKGEKEYYSFSTIEEQNKKYEELKKTLRIWKKASLWEIIKRYDDQYIILWSNNYDLPNKNRNKNMRHSLKIDIRKLSITSWGLFNTVSFLVFNLMSSLNHKRIRRTTWENKPKEINNCIQGCKLSQASSNIFIKNIVRTVK